MGLNDPVSILDVLGIGEPQPEDPNPTRVVNLRREPHEVYIGRAGHGHDGYFGNPVQLGVGCPVCSDVHLSGGTTLDCFEVYARERLERDPEYRRRVAGLWGKVLGCFCKPQFCHGDVLRELAYELHGSTE